VGTSGVRLRDVEPVVGSLADGRLALAGANQQMFLQGTDGGFARLRPPSGLSYSYLRPTGNGLYLVGSPDNQLYRSVDGTGWEKVRR
jgi:hypothetical protein